MVLVENRLIKVSDSRRCFLGAHSARRTAKSAAPSALRAVAKKAGALLIKKELRRIRE